MLSEINLTHLSIVFFCCMRQGFRSSFFFFTVFSYLIVLTFDWLVGLYLVDLSNVGVVAWLAASFVAGMILNCVVAWLTASFVPGMDTQSVG